MTSESENIAMDKFSDFNLDEELKNEVIHLYVTTKTFVNLHRNLPVSKDELDLWNFFAVVSRSLEHAIVISIGRLILDRRKDVANIDWFIERLRAEGRLTAEEYSDVTRRIDQLRADFEPFKRARNKVYAHKDISVMEGKDPVIIKVKLDAIERLVGSLWSLYNEISEKSRDTTVEPPTIGPAGLEQLRFIIREYYQGPYKQICDAMHSEHYKSFTAQDDSFGFGLHILFKEPDGTAIEDIEENDIIKHYANGKLIGLTINNRYR